MSTSRSKPSALAARSALVIGVGGLGCPALLGLAQAGIGRLVLCDDDDVEESNLHRQLLFEDEDIGTPKLDAAQRRLQAQSSVEIELVRSRFLPENARKLVRSVDIVLEGADNFATKFLAADVCQLESRPIVHGAGVRWRSTAWAVSSRGRPCYRCLFEDVPGAGLAPNCSEAGVIGPVVGLGGALMTELALRILSEDHSGFGAIYTFDGLKDRLRRVEINARQSCPLCGDQPRISRSMRLDTWHPRVPPETGDQTWK